MTRKPSDLVQVKFRIPERLRRLIEVEAKKSKRTQAQEMVQRLEQSFLDQGVEALIQSVVDRMANIHDRIDAIAKEMGRPDLVANLKKGEDGND
jgi:hypothetical protein